MENNKQKSQIKPTIKELASLLGISQSSIKKIGDNLTVGGGLDLSGTQITALPDNLTVGGYLDLRGTQITALPDNLTVGGGLYLSGTQITALPDNLTVGGGLDLSGTQITALPDNLTVGGGLYLNGTQITALPDNLTVGGYLDLNGTQITAPKKINRPEAKFSIKLKFTIECKFNARGYSIADGILAKVIDTKQNLRKIQIIGKKKYSYLISDENGNYAHGETIREAQADLAFKIASKDVEQFRNMTIDTIKTPEEWSFVYRAITGACQAGIKTFMESKGKLKKKYTLSEILEETKGAYGYEKFKEVVKG